MTSKWIRVGGAAVIALLVIASLSSAFAQPRTVLGWQLEHALGYFIATLIICLAWPRPLKVAGTMIVLHMILEGLQALNPDRHPNLFAVVYGTAGVLAAAILAEFLIRVRHRKA
jgi:VanZ family protein